MYSYDLVTNNSRIWSRVLCLCMAWNWTQEYYVMRCAFHHASLVWSTEDCSYAKSISSVYPQITSREISRGGLPYLEAPKMQLTFTLLISFLAHLLAIAPDSKNLVLLKSVRQTLFGPGIYRWLHRVRTTPSSISIHPADLEEELMLTGTTLNVWSCL